MKNVKIYGNRFSSKSIFLFLYYSKKNGNVVNIFINQKIFILAGLKLFSKYF